MIELVRCKMSTPSLLAPWRGTGNAVELLAAHATRLRLTTAAETAWVVAG